jgi:CRP-like cAMP-binding protein
MPTARSTQELLLSALQDAKNRLEYLSHNDWMLIIDRAKQAVFKKGEPLILQNKASKSLFVIVSGKVNVSVSGTMLARIGPGEICGEMAFLEDTLPSASATAEEEVHAFVIEWQVLSDVFELFPHLASRFYRSLAVNLSRRLREQIVGKKRQMKAAE